MDLRVLDTMGTMGICVAAVFMTLKVGFECILFLSAFVCVASTLDGCRYIDHFAISVYSEHL